MTVPRKGNKNVAHDNVMVIQSATVSERRLPVTICWKAQRPPIANGPPHNLRASATKVVGGGALQMGFWTVEYTIRRRSNGESVQWGAAN